MAASFLDYFRCEPFELNFRLHVFGGFWPLETNDKRQQVVFSIFSYLCYFSITSMLVIQFLDLYLLRNDFLNFTEDLCSICISFAIVAKSHLVLFNADVVNKLRQDFTDYKNSLTDPDDVEILERSNRQILTIVKTFYGITVPCVIFWILYPGLDAADEKKVPFPYVLPVEEWTTPIYIGLYFYQTLSMIGFMINVLSVDSQFCGFVLRINAHYDIVIKNLKALGGTGNAGDGDDGQDDGPTDGEDDERSEAILRLLKYNVKLHKKVLREIDVFEKIYQKPILVHFLGVTTVIGAVVIDLVVISKGFRLQIFQRMLYLTIALWDTFLYCFFGSKIQQKSLDLSAAAYSCKWYRMKPRVRRQLALISLKCQRVPKIQVGNLFPMELKTFLNLLKFSYDITAVLYQTAKE